VRRRSAGSGVSSWFSRALAAESLDEVKGSANSSAEFTCGVTGEEDSMVAQAEKAVSLVLGIEQEIWLVEDLLFALCIFEGETLKAAADKVDEFEVQSELVDEDLTVFRERGVGILDAFRTDAGLDPELTSNERELVGTVVALTAENDN